MDTKNGETAMNTLNNIYDFSMNREANRRASFRDWPFDENCNCTAEKVCNDCVPAHFMKICDGYIISVHLQAMSCNVLVLSAPLC